MRALARGTTWAASAGVVAATILAASCGYSGVATLDDHREGGAPSAEASLEASLIERDANVRLGCRLRAAGPCC